MFSSIYAMKMKRKYLLFVIPIAIGMGAILTACSDTYSRDEVIPAEQSDYNLTHSADFIFYSGTTLIGSTYETRANDASGNLWYQNWERPTNVTDAERQRVVEAFSQKREGEINTVSVTWNNFWVQQVYKGEQTYTDGYGQNIGLGSDHMDMLSVFNNLKTTVISWWPYEEKTEEYDGQYEHIWNFNNGNNTTTYTDDVTHQEYIGTMLVKNVGTDGRDEQFAYFNSTDSKYHYEYIILKIDGSYYMGFDFYAHGTDVNPYNKNQDVERDWVFNDWIVKVSPAQKIGEEAVETDLHETPSGPVCPEDPGLRKGEVEVNLSINGERDENDFVLTKLSIHLRDTVDVEIFIPVTPAYYCDADDMEIVLSRYEDIEMVSPQPNRTEYNVNGHTVVATVSYETTGIKVKTEGLVPEVLKFLRNSYADGLTIEIWNYYNEYTLEQGRAELKKLLDQSTISFSTKPARYVNAITLIHGEPSPLDCVVTALDATP